MLQQLFGRQPSLSVAAASLDKHRIPAEQRAQLAEFLDKSAPREVSHFNPRYLGERLKLDERATLKLLLAGLYEGLVALHWDVRCPLCGNLNAHDSLGALHHDFQCQFCGGSSTPRLDNEVRVTFSVHPRFRSLPPAANERAFRDEVDARLGPVFGPALLVLPDFQRLFPQERLLPDESLEVQRMALLFTDLAGSTALYAARGDPRAYHLVRLHFDELFEAAGGNGGTVIKNIGDAVMAAFQTPVEALRAALEMQKRMITLNQRSNLPVEEALILKVGLHSGPCLNVTLNERPDFFGTTVNVAARVQGLSHGRDVVFTDAIRADVDAQPLLAGYPLASLSASVKGIEGELRVHRVTVA